jgi:uncharacterized DUF497 family protein
MSKVQFEWDEKKNKENIAKHELPFEVAQKIENGVGPN